MRVHKTPFYYSHLVMEEKVIFYLRRAQDFLFIHACNTYQPSLSLSRSVINSLKSLSPDEAVSLAGRDDQII